MSAGLGPGPSVGGIPGLGVTGGGTGGQLGPTNIK